MSSVENNPESNRFFRKISGRTAALIGGGALASVVLGYGVNSLLHEPETGMASCDALSVTIVDGPRHIVRVRPSIRVSGAAKLAGIYYEFDNGDLPRDLVGADEVEHDYPDAPANQTHHITAIPAYDLNGQEFGGLPVCSKEVTFREPEHGR
jgi:hypothetical protein